MIERQIVAQKVKEKEIETFVFTYLGRLSSSKIRLQRTPLGEKVSVYTSRPGLIVGKKGANIKKLTDILKSKYGMENPQIEVVEIENPLIDAASVARSLISGFERFGAKRFKAMAYKALDDALKNGAKGIELVIGGRGVPGERAKSWRFSAGYLKKSGDISLNFMDRSYEYCNLRSGTIGIKVSILHPDVILPDKVTMKTLAPQVEQQAVKTIADAVPTLKVEEVAVEEIKTEEVKAEEKVKKPRKPRVKKSDKVEEVKTDGN
jgi:small subunit ribosomal protein S3